MFHNNWGHFFYYCPKKASPDKCDTIKGNESPVPTKPDKVEKNNSSDLQKCKILKLKL